MPEWPPIDAGRPPAIQPPPDRRRRSRRKEHTMTMFKAAAIRAVRTIAQTAVALIGTAALITDVEWETVVSGSALAGLLSVLTSIATGLPEADDGRG